MKLDEIHRPCKSYTYRGSHERPAAVKEICIMLLFILAFIVMSVTIGIITIYWIVMEIT